MNLLQLAAIKVTAWPEGADRIVQSHGTGRIMFDADYGFGVEHDFECSEIAEDAYDALVTRAQWEAERARIAAEDAPTWHIGTETEEWREECQKQYEQELLDKVAARLYGMWTAPHISSHWAGDAERAFDAADAFMAERAKRLKGVK